MIVRLHNLAARRPSMKDLASVAALWHIDDDCKDMSVLEKTEEDVQRQWQAQGFQLAQDAWMIVNRKQETVAYADVRMHEDTRSEKELLALTLVVHPAYRGRGVGTLLVRLIEQRARDIADMLPPRRPVALRYIMHSQNVAAKNLLEREGYERLERFWRISLQHEVYEKELRLATAEASLYAEAV